MKQKIKFIFFLITSIRLVPHLCFFYLHSNKYVIQYDVARWAKILSLTKNLSIQFLHLMTYYEEYRNLFYYRIGTWSHLIKWLCPPMNTLFLRASEIGKGLFIQHGFSTSVGAQKIGDNCWINQQVTIGFTNDTDCPVIEDNVTIYVGARVLGNVTVGKNSIIGANAVVIKSVPENCTVVGVPAYIVRRNGVKVKEKL